MPIEDIYLTIKADDVNKKKFVDLYEINPDAPIDPLQKVVPTTEEPFFGTFALNLLVFTKLYLNDSDDWDTDEYSASKARLVATYDRFAKYGLYVFIDGSTDEIKGADSDKLDTFQTLIGDMCTELNSYGVINGGKIDDESTLQDAITQAITDFFS